MPVSPLEGITIILVHPGLGSGRICMRVSKSTPKGCGGTDWKERCRGAQAEVQSERSPWT